jgi:protein ImuB
MLPGEEELRLAPLPIHVLEPGADILEILDGWGIRTFQALASLPPLPLVERLGQEGLRLQRLARGEVKRELVLAESAISFAESMELEEAVELLEPLAFVLNRLLERITTRLEARSLGTDQIRIDLELEIHRDRQKKADSFAAPQVMYGRSLKLPVPTQDAKLLLKLVQLDLAAHPPGGPVKKIALTAEPTRIRSTQTGLFQALAPEPGKLEVALARLRAVVGEQDELGRSRVGAPALVDSHSPDSFELLPFRSDVSSEMRACLSSPKLALRLFRPTVAARVEWNGTTPTAVIFGGAKSVVINCAGPWRSCGLWWDGESK